MKKNKTELSKAEAERRCTNCNYECKLFHMDGINWFYACQLKSRYIGLVVKCPIGREVKDEN